MARSILTFCILCIRRMPYIRPSAGLNGNTQVKKCIRQTDRGIHKYGQCRKIKQTRFGNHKLLVCIGYMDRRRSIYRWQVLDI